ncbi:hypothetical protein ECE50_016215 [Chitinophaga sp. Mgbs1]|uniref:Activator of Hsp90 ATPase homologue 1/2-like C-terminal domain-containing protein n=1 Tax=Chitinophaga solisilvae TaxID=1233460 RepID=A0A9Q5GMC0_9BACT|nr:hypothetical protein [Chitinophaga solisilvae]
MKTSDKAVGHTSSQGWEIGVRRTFPLTADQAWEIIFTQPVLGVWLDNNAALSFRKDDTYTASNGVTITVTSVTDIKVIRMKWQEKNQPAPSTLQIRVIPAGQKTTISFHHERLTDNNDRIAKQQFWSHVLDQIGK